MQAHDFSDIVRGQIETCRSMLITKTAEYAEGEDKLHNFRTAAALGPDGETMRSALAGMMRKHTVSIYDMCYNTEQQSLEKWEEKITDHINYLLLLKAVVVEEMFVDEKVVATPSMTAQAGRLQQQIYGPPKDVHDLEADGLDFHARVDRRV